MIIYWDTGALFRFILDKRQVEITGVTRTHTLAELFSALTGKGWKETLPGGVGRQRRMGLILAAKKIEEIRKQLEFVDLSPDEVVSTINQARERNAQGGRIHDLLHARAAEKARADQLWTVDRNDFAGLGSVPVKQL
jgi:predicted nucleic acid-binding protein